MPTPILIAKLKSVEWQGARFSVGWAYTEKLASVAAINAIIAIVLGVRSVDL